MFAYFWDKRLAQRDAGRFHPECPGRICSLTPQNIVEVGQLSMVESIKPCGESILKLVHDDSYLHLVKTARKNNHKFLDSGDTVVTENIFEDSLIAASAGINAIEAMALGRLTRAFCAIRPPGHHANQLRALGFCVFNNAAIAARFAQKELGLERVLIVDWDVHPGNGTEEIFWRDPTVYTLSIHEEGLFAQAGSTERIGEGDGKGFSCNVNIKPTCNNRDYLSLFRGVVERVVQSFKPELIIISAGFDGHRRDNVSHLKLEDETFASMTRIVLEASMLSAEGRVLSFLEGGYDLIALEQSVKAHCQVLAELPR